MGCKESKDKNWDQELEKMEKSWKKVKGKEEENEEK